MALQWTVNLKPQLKLSGDQRRQQSGGCLGFVNQRIKFLVIATILAFICLALFILFRPPQFGTTPAAWNGHEHLDSFEATMQIPSWALCTRTHCSYSNLTSDPTSIDEMVPYNGHKKEDEVLYHKFFYGMTGGFFLEMGALDGIRFSNTLWFAQAARWRGLLIEPSPDTFEQLVVNRKESICVNAAICSNYQRVHYVIGERLAVRGIYEFMAPAYRQRWHPNITSVKGLPEIPCLPISKLLQWLKIDRIDLWSLDVEGAELMVLEGFDFTHVQVNAIVVEADCDNRDRNPSIDALLTQNGFVKLFHQKCRNSYFVHKKYVAYISTSES